MQALTSPAMLVTGHICDPRDESTATMRSPTLREGRTSRFLGLDAPGAPFRPVTSTYPVAGS